MRRNWLIYLLTFSLAINVATAAALIFFWIQNQAMAETSVGQKSIRSFLREDVKFSSEQAKPILALIDERKQEMMFLRAQMEARRAELMKLISSVPADKGAVTAKMDEISRTQNKMRAIAVSTVIRMAESLPPEATEQFGEYLQTRGRACDVLSTPSSVERKALSGHESRGGAKKGTGQ
jgi:Spy/CpxP family protein refolding chaperone